MARPILKSSPDDFVVEERLSAPLSDDPRGRFWVYRLTKRGRTTPEAARWLARELKVRPGGVSWAGLKDKHALTTQHVSLPAPSGPPPSRVSGEGLSAEFAGTREAPLAAGDILENRFRVTLRGLSEATLVPLLARLSALPDPAPFANYFGEQRFSGVKHAQAFAARFLLRGEIREALRLLLADPRRKEPSRQKEWKRLAAAHWGDWPLLTERLAPGSTAWKVAASLRDRPSEEAAAWNLLPFLDRQMTVEAYQSHLWNGVLSRCLAAHGLARPETGRTRLGPLFPLSDAPVDPVWFERAMPFPSADDEPPEFARRALAEVLEEEGFSRERLSLPAALRPPFSGGKERPLLARAADLSWERPDASSLRLNFTLPRGAYATVFLRALEGIGAEEEPE